VSEYRTYILNENEMEHWDEYINRSSNGTIFHTSEWLRAAESHANMKLLPVVVSKGNYIVCLLPLFYRRNYGLRILMSPPVLCAIPYLGPAFVIPSSNRYNYEQTYIDVIDEIIFFAEKSIGFDYMRIVHPPGVIDMRPYTWKKFYVHPRYTYIFDLTAKSEELYNHFHPTTKNAVKKAFTNQDIVTSRDKKYAQDVLKLVRKRFTEKKKNFQISDGYFTQLINSSLSDNIESIAILHNDRVVAGDITLTDKKNAYAWIGSVSRDENFRGVGELVLWEKIKEYVGRGCMTFDIIGANRRDIRKHKAKYGAQLVDYYVVQKTSMKGGIALSLMNRYGKVNDE
jgi:hypothetical protein